MLALTQVFYISISNASQDRLKLILFLDKSTSMEDELQVLADLSEQITEKLSNRCSEYSIAVSELEYGDIQSDPVGLIGFPAFITEEHPNPAEALKERILSNLPTQDCSSRESCISRSAAHVGTKEFTYSSVVTTFQRNRNQIFNEPIRHLSAFIVTDAAPLAEPYSVDQAVEHIGSFIPLNKFSATTLSHENWNDIRGSCTLDLPDRISYTNNDLKRLNRFAHYTHGFAFNICESRSPNMKVLLEQQIDDFLNDIIMRGCLLVS